MKVKHQQSDLWQIVRCVIREFRTTKVNIGAAAIYIVCTHYNLSPSWHDKKEFLIRLLDCEPGKHQSGLSNYLSKVKNYDFHTWSLCDCHERLYKACHRVEDLMKYKYGAID